MWACFVEGFNTLVTTSGLNLPDKRVDQDCWLRSWFEFPRRQHGFKPLSGSHHLRTLHCRATQIFASFGGLMIYCHFHFHFMLVRRSYHWTLRTVIVTFGLFGTIDKKMLSLLQRQEREGGKVEATFGARCSQLWVKFVWTLSCKYSAWLHCFWLRINHSIYYDQMW